jgi:diazepam-binding inhibitor (GABA receptor modulator, acyl-CoA-binding protein)
MGLKEDFEAAQTLASTPSNEFLLELYALYKQATVGDVDGKRPGMMDFKGRAKYDAWSERKGISKDDAMTKYVALVEKLASGK